MSMEKSFNIKPELQQLVVDSVISVGLDFMRRVVLATPRDKGHAQANWVVGMNTRDPRQYKTRTNASNAIRRGGTIIKSLTYSAGMTIHISNNLPYIRKLNDGHSQQAPKLFAETAARGAGINLKGRTL